MSSCRRPRCLVVRGCHWGSAIGARGSWPRPLIAVKRSQLITDTPVPLWALKPLLRGTHDHREMSVHSQNLSAPKDMTTAAFRQFRRPENVSWCALRCGSAGRIFPASVLRAEGFGQGTIREWSASIEDSDVVYKRASVSNLRDAYLLQAPSRRSATFPYYYLFFQRPHQPR